MIVCVCRAQSDRAIETAIAGGAVTVDEVGRVCRAGTDCGACRPLLERLISAACATDPQTAQDGRDARRPQLELGRVQRPVLEAPGG